MSIALCWGQAILPANMYEDSLHAPFIYGVASGDPVPDGIVLWTYVLPEAITDNVVVSWEITTDSTFASIIQSGNTQTDSTTDFTVNVEISGLSSGMIYYYRFYDAFSQYSAIGRTKTAQSGNVQELKIAVMSCSSIYSGFFNAYKRLSERESLDAIIHLGDYVYDYADPDEEIRMPIPAHTEPATLSEWRERHKYYLLDPDLRLARQNHPWIPLWDNHDMPVKGVLSDGNQAFREYLPIRRTSQTLADTIYRDFHFGNLLDLWINDVTGFRTVDTFPNGATAIMNHAQSQWLLNGLSNSQARWKMMGSQKMMGGWYTTGIPQQILDLVPDDGPVFDDSSWDGYPESRNEIIDLLRNQQIDNFIAVSGDSHVSVAMDLVKNPHDTLEYNPQTGEGSVGVEFLPTSISRGNVDETGVAAFLIPTFTNFSNSANPQHVYSEFTAHGYGLLTLRPDSVTAEYYYSPILALSNTETLAKKLVVRNGDNHWSKLITTDIPEPEKLLEFSEVFPNPSGENLNLFIVSPRLFTLYAEIVSEDGKLIQRMPIQAKEGKTQISLEVKKLSSGKYYLKISSSMGSILALKPFVKL